MISKELLDYFKGDHLAANVWYNKYRFGDEQTPEDSNTRYVKELSETELKRLKTIKKKNFKALSLYGMQRYTNLKDKDLEGIKTYIKNNDLIGLKSIIPGGSLMQGIGQHHLYSSLSNCLVLGSVHDSYSGISLKSEELVQTCKRRMGNGLNLSELRPHGARIHNQATSSTGIVAIADRFSNLTKEVAQFGRRGACMLNVHINHPDAIMFAEHKQNLSNLTGVNISIILDDEFIDAVLNKQETYFQRWPIQTDISGLNADDFEFETLTEISDMVYVKKINPVETWNKIIHFAWNTGEPGLLFANNWRRWGTDWAYEQYRPISTNPCSEIPMQAYDSCRLMSINLLNCVTPDGRIDYERIYQLAYEQQTFMDCVVDLDIEYIDRIIDKIASDKNEPEELKRRELMIWEKIKTEAINGRRTGSGFTGLGDLLMLHGNGYSVKSMEIIEYIFDAKMRAELDATIDMAILYGTFKGYDFKLESALNNEMFNHIRTTFPLQFERMKKFGRRNVSWSTAAPTGSISILAQCTSGVEPMFEPFSFRRIKCTKPTDRVDFIDPADGQKFTVYKSYHFNFVLWITQNSNLTVEEVYNLDETELQSWLDKSPFAGQSANYIYWQERVQIQELIQKYTTHAISSTVNLPNNVAEEVVSNIYLASSKSGLKGITVFRDGCRAGVFDTGKVKKTEHKAGPIKRPEALESVVFDLMYRNKPFSVFIGLYDNKPYELFIVQTKETFDYHGQIIKQNINGTKQYVFVQEGSEPFVVSNEFDDLKETSLYLSMLMRYGTPIEIIIKTLLKTEPIAGTFTHRLIKILSKYITDGTSTGIQCPDCGDTLVFENGCSICKSCGHTKC